MQNAYVTTGIWDISDIDLSEKASVVITSMTGNVNFPNPNPSMPVMTAHKTNYDSALIKADDGTIFDSAHKKEMKKELKDALKVLSRYVQNNCQNSESIILSSGFSLRKGPDNSIFPMTPTHLRLLDGIQSGEVRVYFKKPPQRVLGYNLRYTNDLNSGIWTTTDLFTKTRTTLTGLPKGKDVWVQVRSVNANGVSSWSSPVLLEMVR